MEKLESGHFVGGGGGDLEECGSLGGGLNWRCWLWKKKVDLTKRNLLYD